QCGRLDERAHRRLVDPGVTDLLGARLLDEHGHELRLDARMDENPRARRTILPGVPECRSGKIFGDLFEPVSRVRHHDLRALSSALEGDVLEVAVRRIAQERASDLGRTRERHDVDVHVETERLACDVSEAGYDIEYPVGQ